MKTTIVMVVAMVVMVTIPSHTPRPKIHPPHCEETSTVPC